MTREYPDASVMNTPSPFQQLLLAAAGQAEPQRLLFVFAAAELPPEASAAQTADFAAGRGGALAPLMCVDKSLTELSSFEALQEEAARAGPPWQVVFIAGLPDPADAARIEQALTLMVERVRDGRFGGLLALDRDGELLNFLH